MQIFIKTLTGKSISLNINDRTLVSEVKKMIQDEEGIRTEEQRLIFCGKQLEDDQTMVNYNVSEGSIVHLVLRLR